MNKVTIIIIVIIIIIILSSLNFFKSLGNVKVFYFNRHFYIGFLSSLLQFIIINFVCRGPRGMVLFIVIGVTLLK